ncbi:MULTISPECIES: prepilin peptidase [Vibrio]|uniref:Peptidase n=2 Tax=Vibrio TaxID=662 RepID=A0A2N7NGE1_9VIBR|nr:prepilin peptidase [Vibrio tasmaniensis]PMP13427.1 peptidase [Vibrio tasmaniensis]TKG37450.1 prepilin peptidase [Vibrio tasmaniensis]TKG40642.1 prepilin peptidase [Vibrio tasmaniensis]TKG48290.1 prepilin peptidase [Vibrio tasmaniensis]TKG48421.1 prepilin peptidase [Vibrio tasmaniensis]
MPHKLWWLIPLATMAAIVSYQDIRYRIIPNGVVVAVALLGVFYICQTEKFEQFYNFFIVLAVGAVLFYFNVIAAGDSKLLAAFSLMVSPNMMLWAVNVILFAGGTLAITQWVLGKTTGNSEWTNRGVPYGVPICLGSLLGIAASL